MDRRQASHVNKGKQQLFPLIFFNLHKLTKPIEPDGAMDYSFSHNMRSQLTGPTCTLVIGLPVVWTHQYQVTAVSRDTAYYYYD